MKFSDNVGQNDIARVGKKLLSGCKPFLDQSS